MKKKQPKRKLFGKFTVTNKSANQLAINEMTTPRKSGRYRGTSVVRTKAGWHVTTHRARSKSYSTLAKIPSKDITFIRGTG